MLENTQLSIALPTYNRAEFLDHCLTIHIPFFKSRNIPVYISDNGSTDHTREIVEKHMFDYPFIHYCRNDRTIEPDENFEKVLGYPDSEYVWLLGDTYTIPEKVIDAFFLAIVADRYDAIVVNVENRVKGIDEQIYTDRDKLLGDLGWHMTCLSVLIYSRTLLSQANFARFRNTNFLQTGILFEHFAERPFTLRWLPGYSVISSELKGVKKISWESQTFEIWTKRWSNFIFSLPPLYSLDAKLKCIMDHGIYSSLFTFSGLKRLRKNNILTFTEYRAYKKYFAFTINIPKPIIALLSILPKRFISMIS